MTEIWKPKDFTSHVDTKDFIRAFWLQNSNGQYLSHSAARVWWSDDASTDSRLIALHLSSRSRYALLSQTKSYLDISNSTCTFASSELSPNCWLYHTKKDNFVLPDGTSLGLSGGALVPVSQGDNSELPIKFERISAVSSIDVLGKYGLTKFSSEEEEVEKFGNRVAELKKNNKPILLYIGCGLTIRPGFLHIDLSMPTSNLVEHELLDNLFRFPIGNQLPILDDCVDFVFTEDFIEHLPQMVQIKFLAEALRILKPGHVNRVNTPCVLHSMKNRSDFSKGAIGVYEHEWTGWGHINVLSKSNVQEFSEMIGYSSINFMEKNESISEFHTGDVRPKGDRLGKGANIYADLVK